jgi:uncharacterized protein YcbX
VTACTLSELNVFPVKSARGISVPEWRLGPRGLDHDRELLVVDPDGRFVTMRERPRMALIETALEPGVLVLRTHGRAPLQVSLADRGPERIQVQVWNDRVLAEPVGAEADDWLTRFLDTPCRLVRFPDQAHRQVDLAYAQPGDQVRFADGFSLLLIGEASLAALNARLAEPLSMARFRTNLVASGGEPFAEDGWRRIRIGSIELDLVKPCARCVITTVDEATGIPGLEPLRTLATFRRRNGKVLFGQNLVHRGTGTLRVGDEIQVLA